MNLIRSILNKKYILPSNTLLTPELLSHYINAFFQEVYYPLQTKTTDMHLSLMCKVAFTDTTIGWRSLADLRKVNFEDKEKFISYLSASLGLLNDSYRVNNVRALNFSFKTNEGLAPQDRSLNESNTIQSGVHTHKYNELELPLTMDPLQYGTLISKSLIEGGQIFVIKNGLTRYEIEVRGIENKVTLIRGKELTWVDTALNNHSFNRVLGKNSLYIEDGKISVKTKIISTKMFQTINKDKNLIEMSQVLTMDIETNNEKGKHKPYLICGYNPQNTLISTVNETTDKDISEMFRDFIFQLIKIKDIKMVYAHNLSAFDGVLIMKHLIKFPEAKVIPLIHNGRIISITFKIKGRKIVFKDSLLMLPMSLRKLCDAFSVPIRKSHFPVLFNNINYIGIVPEYNYWKGLKFSEWNEMRNSGRIWDFRVESLKYCIDDCISLYQILEKFNHLTFNEFSINALNCLTLPSLAMKIYKAKYMPENTIPQLNGILDQDIRDSYTGGAVDVFIPHNYILEDKGTYNKIHGKKKLYYYDVNSLYPFIMAILEMPVGLPTAFIGDIRKFNPDAFGFFYCRITTPTFLLHPILQRRIKTVNGVRTIAGLGIWEGWITSIEMNAALQLGYKIDIIHGYTFNRKNIFMEYIEHMYNLRQQYSKTDPMNLIAKLLMNSLYGKFGMKPEKTIVQIFNLSDPVDEIKFKSLSAVDEELIKDWVLIDNFVITIRKTYDKNNSEDSTISNDFHGPDINVGIAAMITAGARIQMSHYKNNPEYNLFYMDTDSIIIDKPLDPSNIGSGLGKMKLEHEINLGIFLAPKVYAIQTSEGKIIKKVKGLAHEIVEDLTLEQFESLLALSGNLDLTQEKWTKKILEGTLSILDVTYSLKVTSSKRKSIYINGIYSGTLPYNYDELIGN